MANSPSNPRLIVWCGESSDPLDKHRQLVADMIGCEPAEVNAIVHECNSLRADPDHDSHDETTYDERP